MLHYGISRFHPTRVRRDRLPGYRSRIRVGDKVMLGLGPTP
ncbi:MAG: hypothetical protein JWM33_3275 [Caulobacteraceae bacterium]|nr:hypothetical protein [Caulobacteraceae bacterium]